MKKKQETTPFKNNCHVDETTQLLALLSLFVLVGVTIFSTDFVSFSGTEQSAQVGAFASAPPNEYNTIAQQLDEKEEELEQREQEVIVREKEVQTRFVERRDQGALIYTTLIGLLLLALILLNFLLDAKRRGREKQTKVSQE